MKLEKDEEALWAQACATFGASVATAWLQEATGATREQFSAGASEWGAMFADGVIEELRERCADKRADSAIIAALADAIEVIRIEHGCGHDTDLMASALARLLEEQPIPRAEKTRLGVLLSEASRL